MRKLLILAMLLCLPLIQAEAAKLNTKELLTLPEGERMKAASEFSTEYYSDLKKIMTDSKEEAGVRWKALTLAAQINWQDSKSIVQQNLKSKEWFLRSASLMALAEKNPPEALIQARELIRDKALIVRSSAVQVLKKSADLKQVRQELWSEMEADYNFRKKQSLWIRDQILEVLSEKPLPEEAPMLVGLLKDNDQDIRIGALAALEKIKAAVGSPEKLKLMSLNQKMDYWLQKSAEWKTKTSL